MGWHPLDGTAPRSVLLAEDAIRRQPFETAIAFDAQGRELLRKVGGQHQVLATPAELARIRGQLLTHNHPNGLRFPDSDPRSAGNSFSARDFWVAVAADLTVLRAVTPKLRFQIRRPAGGWPVAAGVIEQLHRTIEFFVDDEFTRRIAQGTLTAEEAEANLDDEVARRLTRQLGVRYERWEG